MAEKQRALLKAHALGDVKTANSINESLSAEERDQHYLVTIAFFAGLTGHRFGDSPSRSDIDSFVHEMHYDYRNASPQVNFRIVEALVRAVYGEDKLLDGISVKDQYLAQLPVIRKIVAQSGKVQEHLDDYLADAESLAQQWTSQ